MQEIIPLIRVNQWLDLWNVSTSNSELGKAPRHFYVASMSLAQLRVLCGVNKRTKVVRKKTSKGAGFQRELDVSRTKTIARYIQYGYPVSSDVKLNIKENASLIHPGWLPTPILINILVKDDERWVGGEKVKVKDSELIRLDKEECGREVLIIPNNLQLGGASGKVKPIEIIDGQHRVFAVDEIENLDASYQVPVVVFVGLPQTWQAYLFWVINVEPKKINPSLAYDLYPELRSEEWLEIKDGSRIYRDHRAQELADIMWRHPSSPWKDRIELFGNRVAGHVSNATFIRSLVSSFLRNANQRGLVGGLFSSIILNGEKYVVPWKRVQQAAFLIFCWKKIKESAVKMKKDLDEKYRIKNSQAEQDLDESCDLPALLGSPVSLLTTDQGISAVHSILNLFCIKKWEDLGLVEWTVQDAEDDLDDETIEHAIGNLKKNKKLDQFLSDLAEALVTEFDWRTSGALNLSEDEQKLRAAYRGGSGYSLLRRDILQKLKESKYQSVCQLAESEER